MHTTSLPLDSSVIRQLASESFHSVREVRDSDSIAAHTSVSCHRHRPQLGRGSGQPPDPDAPRHCQTLRGTAQRALALLTTSCSWFPKTRQIGIATAPAPPHRNGLLDAGSKEKFSGHAFRQPGLLPDRSKPTFVAAHEDPSLVKKAELSPWSTFRGDARCAVSKPASDALAEAGISNNHIAK